MTLRASSAQRYLLCPGSLTAEQGCQKQSESDAARRGTLVAKIIADMIRSGIKENLTETEETEIAASLVARFEKASSLKVSDCELLLCEQELNWNKWTGHPDLIIRDKQGIIHVIDWKSGFAGYDDAVDNAQIRVYAVGAWKVWCKEGDQKIYGWVVGRSGELKPVVFGSESIKRAEYELNEAAEKCQETDAERYPSTHACQYCTAFGTNKCHETSTAMIEAMPVGIVQSFEKQLAIIPVEQIASLEDKCAMIGRLHEVIRDEIKARLTAGNAVPGYNLGAGRTTKQITDTGKAFSLLSEINQEAFLRACKLSLPELAKATKEILGNGKETLARKILDDRLSSIIVEKQGEPMLIRE